MSDLRVKFDGARLSLAPGGSLAFGRTATEPGIAKGWGYSGRFLDLGTDPRIPRVWGDLVWLDGLWGVRSLAAFRGVGVKVGSNAVTELPPWRSAAAARGEDAETLAVTAPEFSIVLSVAIFSFKIDCSWDGLQLSADPRSSRPGTATLAQGDRVVPMITAYEHQVLWHLAREYRLGAPSGKAPRPLSYHRIAHAVGKSDRSTKSAVERLKRKFEEAELITPGVASDDKRDEICHRAVEHMVFELLADRYGQPSD